LNRCPDVDVDVDDLLLIGTVRLLNDDDSRCCGMRTSSVSWQSFRTANGKSTLRADRELSHLSH
jgi:hypothetical protein